MGKANLREWKKEDRERACVDWVQSLPQVPGAAVSCPLAIELPKEHCFSRLVQFRPMVYGPEKHADGGPAESIVERKLRGKSFSRLVW